MTALFMTKWLLIGFPVEALGSVLRLLGIKWLLYFGSWLMFWSM